MGTHWNMGNTLNTLQTPLNTRKPFFTIRVTKHLQRLPREVMDSPSLETLKNCLDMVLGTWLCVPLLEGRLTR